ncbi:MAG: sterol desaturase family protein [Pseudomonadales bacterium]|nr:sterol desaturase family protein [Pseudomonadales bacterium]
MNELLEYLSGPLLEILRTQGIIWLKVFAFDTQRYFIGVGIVVLVLNVLLSRWSATRRIQDKRATRTDLRREIGYSLLTTMIYASVGLFTVAAIENGWTHRYQQLSDYSWVYAVFSFLALFIVHDAYFYWVHRLMHHKKLFAFFHKVHHRSRTPSAWAAYSFAPGEAMLMALFIPVMLMLVPLHPTVIFIYLACMIIRNAMGHSGIEFHHHGWVDSGLDIFTTITHHDLHHQKFNANYALYFTWWDRWMGTELPQYKEVFRSIVKHEDLPDSRSQKLPGQLTEYSSSQKV